MSSQYPNLLVPATPCRAKDPDFCRYHAAYRQLQEALETGDAEAYLTARDIIATEHENEMSWLTKSIKTLASRPVGKQFYTDDDIRIRLIWDYQAEIKRLRHQPGLTAQGRREGLQLMTEYLAAEKPNLSKRTFMRLPLSGEDYSHRENELARAAASHAEERFVPADNAFEGRHWLYGKTWVEGTMEIRPSPQDNNKDHIWVMIHYSEKNSYFPERPAEPKTSGASYKSLEQFLRLYRDDRITPEFQDFLDNKYDPNSQDDVRRNGLHDAARSARSRSGINEREKVIRPLNTPFVWVAD